MIYFSKKSPDVLVVWVRYCIGIGNSTFFFFIYVNFSSFCVGISFILFIFFVFNINNNNNNIIDKMNYNNNINNNITT
jgi:hypothetical protein